MRKILLILISSVVLLSSCKTTEENYRQSYQKAVTAKDDDDFGDKLVQDLNQRTIVTSNGDTIGIRSSFVKVLDKDNAEQLKRYNAVIGQFKQKFNANSLRSRIATAGYPEAFVLESAETYFYVVISSHSKVTDAGEAIANFKKNNPGIGLRPPMPIIIEAPDLKRPGGN